jgi:serine/threonine protein kinase
MNHLSAVEVSTATTVEKEKRPTGDHTLSRALGGRYEIHSILGTGAYGEVYKAKDTVLDRSVAVKRIRLDVLSDSSRAEDIRRRFLLEARLAAGLQHPNIVTIHDIVSTFGLNVIVMELIDGITLQDRLAAKGPLSLAETIHIVSRVAEALDHAHRNGVVHRDIKPANILISNSGGVKVTDFGVAKSESSNATSTGMLLGTPNYMSPEMVRGEAVDGRSDLFSLGSVMYECIVGDKPFRSASLTGTLMRIAKEEPLPIDFDKRGLPPSFKAVLQTALAKDPAHRFSSGRELAEALRATPVGGAMSSIRTAFRPAAAEAPLTTQRQVHEWLLSLEDSTQNTLLLKALRQEARRLRPRSSLSQMQNEMLTPEEGYLLSRVDGFVTPSDIFSVSPVSELETVGILMGLLNRGFISFEGEASDAIRRTGEQTAEPAGETRTPPYVREQAKALYLAAEKAYERKDYWRVVELCQKATEMVGDRPEYFHLLGLALLKNPAWKHEAEHNLQRATELGPDVADYFYSLGIHYQAQGYKWRARKAFERAEALEKGA